MKRLLVLLSGLALAFSLGSVSLVSGGSGTLCPANEGEIRYYDTDNFGTSLGWQCSNGFPVFVDQDFSDGSGGFQGSDNDKAESVKFYGVTGQKWCFLTAEHDHNGGEDWTYSVVGVGPREVNLRDTIDNKVSSFEAWKVATTTTPC